MSDPELEGGAPASQPEESQECAPEVQAEVGGNAVVEGGGGEPRTEEARGLAADESLSAEPSAERPDEPCEPAEDDGEGRSAEGREGAVEQAEDARDRPVNVLAPEQDPQVEVDLRAQPDEGEPDEAASGSGAPEAEAGAPAQESSVEPADAPEEAQGSAPRAASDGPGGDGAGAAANEDLLAEVASLPERRKAEPKDPDALQEIEAATIEAPVDEEVDTPFEKLASKAKRFSPERIRTILESLLFVTDKPLSEQAISQVTGLTTNAIREQLEKLQGSYRDGVRGIVLHEVAGGWQFRTDPTNAEFVRRFLKVKPQRLTRAALETLAIIAYRQPVTRPEIEEIRGVDCGAVVKALLERHLIKIIGKREEPGRPLLYGTTQEFLEFFNLRDLGSLPTLREFHELSEENREIVEKETGGAAEPPKGTDSIVADLKDNTFEQKLQETTAEANAALAELELALADSDDKAKEAARLLNSTTHKPEPGGDDDAGEDSGD
ncbi:MAG: SMC-Scp complex subunit ScpB [Myxococcales bacterium]